MAVAKPAANYAGWWGNTNDWSDNSAWKAAGATNQAATTKAIYDQANKAYQTYNNNDIGGTFDSMAGKGADWMSSGNLSNLLTSDGYGRYYDARNSKWMKSQTNPNGTYKWEADDAFGQKLNDYIGSNSLAASNNFTRINDAGKDEYLLKNYESVGNSVSNSLKSTYGDYKGIDAANFANKLYSLDDLAKMHAAGGVDKYLTSALTDANKTGYEKYLADKKAAYDAANPADPLKVGYTPGAGGTPGTAEAPQMGLVEQIDPNAGKIDPSSLSQWQSSQYTIDPTKDTVQGQLAGLLSSDNPILQRARTKALQGMNERGLLNSSMAQQASDEAWYSAALPIAGEDAKAYLSNGQQNVQYQNQAGQFNADYANKATFGNADSALKVASANLDSRQKTALANLDSVTKTGLANIESSYRQLMQVNQSVGDYYKQAVKNISDIQGNQNLSGVWKNNAVKDQVAMLENYLSITGAMSNLDLSSTLDFSGLYAIKEAAKTASTSSGGATTESSALATEADFKAATGTMNPLAPAEYASYKSGGGTLSAADWYKQKYPDAETIGSGLINQRQW